MTARAVPMDDTRESVILVDERDRETGVCGKLEAHRRDLRHRAFSVFLFDREDRLLLQRRAPVKYHSAGLWANSCCGHPRVGEDVRAAAERRTHEELGIACRLLPAGTHAYDAAVGSGLFEREYVHLFVGRFDGVPDPEPAEVCDIAWLSPAAVRRDIAARPGHYAAWIRNYANAAWFGRLTRHVRPESVERPTLRDGRRDHPSVTPGSPTDRRPR